MIENRVIYLVFWILNECVCIGTRKVASTKYLNRSMCFPLVHGIGLIRWISLQAKTTLFAGQNLNAKTTLILGRRE